MPTSYAIPTRRERNLRYLEFYGFGLLSGALIVLVALVAMGRL